MKHHLLLISDLLRKAMRGDKISQIAASNNVARSTLRGWIARAEKLGLTADILREATEKDLQEWFRPSGWHRNNVVEPDYDTIYTQSLAQGHSVWQCYKQYLASVAEGKEAVSKAAFYKKMQWFEKNASPEQKQIHLFNSYRAGQISMIDYSGDGLTWFDKKEQKTKTAQIFVGILCFSGLIFCYATERQTRRDWLQAIAEMFDFYGGVTEELFLDNSTSLVRKADKYSPQLSKEFENFCHYYHTLGVAVAPGKSRHKAPVENAVRLCQRKILEPLARHKFFSLRDINQAIEPFLEELNMAEFTEKPGKNRRDLYERQEKRFLRPLPLLRYDPDCVVKYYKVLKGNQIRIKNIRYNIKWGYVGQTLMVRINQNEGMVYFYDRQSGEEICKNRLRSPQEGHEPMRVENVPEYAKPYLEDHGQLLKRIRDELGDSAYLIAQHLAKPQNTQSKKHLLGFLQLSKRYRAQTLLEIYQKLLLKPVITFNAFRTALKEIEAKKARNKVLSHGTLLEISDCRDIRGKSYYQGRFKENHHE